MEKRRGKRNIYFEPKKKRELGKGIIERVMIENFPQVITDINLFFQIKLKPGINTSLWNSKDKRIPKAEKRDRS